jgi:hypothetical protein
VKSEDGEEKGRKKRSTVDKKMNTRVYLPNVFLFLRDRAKDAHIVHGNIDALQLLSTFFPSNQSRTEISVSTLPSVMVAGVTRSAACRCQSMSAACHADLQARSLSLRLTHTHASRLDVSL